MVGISSRSRCSRSRTDNSRCFLGHPWSLRRRRDGHLHRCTCLSTCIRLRRIASAALVVVVDYEEVVGTLSASVLLSHPLGLFPLGLLPQLSRLAAPLTMRGVAQAQGVMLRLIIRIIVPTQLRARQKCRAEIAPTSSKTSLTVCKALQEWDALRRRSCSKKLRQRNSGPISQTNRVVLGTSPKSNSIRAMVM